MVDYTELLLLLGITYLIYLVLYKKHPFIAGIFFIICGAATWMVQQSQNPYGLILIGLGVIVFFTTPFNKGVTG